MTPAQELIHLACVALLVSTDTDLNLLKTMEWCPGEAEIWLARVAAGERRIDISIDEFGIWPCLR